MSRRSQKNTVRWLLLCFPYGLYLMWRRSCRWPSAVKGLITCAFVSAIVALIVWPSPTRPEGTKITLVGAEPAAEIFGPEMPASYDAEQFMVTVDDDTLIAQTEDEDTIYVYASASGGSTYYHTANCKFAYASARRMTLYEAYVMGYTTPCGACNPPIFDPVTGSAKDNPGTVAAQ